MVHARSTWMMVVFAAVTTACPAAVRASLIVDAIGAPMRIGFDEFEGRGFTPGGGSGTLDSETWRVRGLGDGDGRFGGHHVVGDFARGAGFGGVTAGGVYAFEVEPGDRALGFQPAGRDFTPGDVTLRLENGTGRTITDIVLAFQVHVLNDQDRATSFDFSWSFDDVTWTAVPSLDLRTPREADGVPAWRRHGHGTRITELALAAGGILYLRWSSDDLGGTGPRDELALDGVALVAMPGPATLLALGAAGLAVCRPRRVRRTPHR